MRIDEEGTWWVHRCAGRPCVTATSERPAAGDTDAIYRPAEDTVTRDSTPSEGKTLASAGDHL
ncbi:MAG TPA: hypothetical protein VIW24_16785 [Aldersonia sp.]